MSNIHTYIYRGQKVAYRKTGTGKPLVILHGWGTGSRVMMPVAQSLADRRTCYIPDLPGFGDSDAPERAWSIDDYTDLITAFISDLDLQKPDILAHSFGGRIMLKLCARKEGEQLVDKVLITGGAGMKPRRSISFYLKKYVAKFLKMPLAVLPPGLRTKAEQRLRDTSLWKSLGSSDYAKLSGVMRETFVKSVTEFLEPTLPEIKHELLLLWGRNDDATPLYQAKRMEEGLKNGALVVIENAGHYAFLDQPKRFASIARAFFDSDQG